LRVDVVEPTFEVTSEGDVFIEVDILSGPIQTGRSKGRLFAEGGGALDVIIVIVIGEVLWYLGRRGIYAESIRVMERGDGYTVVHGNNNVSINRSAGMQVKLCYHSLLQPLFLSLIASTAHHHLLPHIISFTGHS
jgi:hypothetical protein